MSCIVKHPIKPLRAWLSSVIWYFCVFFISFNFVFLFQYFISVLIHSVKLWLLLSFKAFMSICPTGIYIHTSIYTFIVAYSFIFAHIITPLLKRFTCVYVYCHTHYKIITCTWWNRKWRNISFTSSLKPICVFKVSEPTKDEHRHANQLRWTTWNLEIHTHKHAEQWQLCVVIM